jgi:hypothetical protein
MEDPVDAVRQVPVRLEVEDIVADEKADMGSSAATVEEVAAVDDAGVRRWRIEVVVEDGGEGGPAARGEGDGDLLEQRQAPPCILRSDGEPSCLLRSYFGGLFINI